MKQAKGWLACRALPMLERCAPASTDNAPRTGLDCFSRESVGRKAWETAFASRMS
ncbi:hypothetical protein C4K16_2244 [Pseudomonas chlororaphis subsp. aurantiaca]|nr:hypothetical protein C4K16_2244 [Pseudomonas chlororaphis subsp. aurantiaca]